MGDEVPFEQCPALPERCVHEVGVVERQQVERHERRGRLLGEHAHSRLGRMDALLEGVEVEAATLGVGDDDLAVDDASIGQGVERAAAAIRGSTG